MKENYLNIAQNMLSGCLFVPEDYLTAETQIIAIPGFDSISFETLLAQIENYLDIEIRDYKDVIKIKTIQNLADYLESEHAQK